jgi:phosphohistidine phosphatase
MKKRNVILMRHAQAQLERFGHNDRERAITMAGMHELEGIRHKLQTHLIGVSLILCSNAKRTRQTLEGIKPLIPTTTQIIYKDELYQASNHILWSRLQEVNDVHERIMIVAHNPGLSHFVQKLQHSTAVPFREFSTCGVAICEGNFDRWCEVSSHHLKLIEFITA